MSKFYFIYLYKEDKNQLYLLQVLIKKLTKIDKNKIKFCLPSNKYVNLISVLMLKVINLRFYIYSTIWIK